METGLGIGFSIFLAVCFAIIVYGSIKLGQMNQKKKLDAKEQEEEQ